MTTPQKNLPRFLPTLTEVVRPVATGTETTPSPQTTTSPMPAAEALVERVMQRLTPTLETRLRAVVTALVQEQVSALEPYLWQEVDQALRQQVAEAVALELDALARR
ncbi:hypothetical protein [Hydrogenophaga sp.]|jgi:hypothetical protein|uniref:hypothetical protein n=1 Tax=Hydrogenophaga sp. TaxID=1904254 RepID=UPI0027311BFB|nr:hypothetical protein [Hydrogenophaga sp.]MDP1656023.1 hypothetical protein [Hylemonella sp.]MDP2017768.1 hypothetical protein [Hydrogenophaga sp.]